MLEKGIQEYLEKLFINFEKQVEIKLNAAIDKMDYISTNLIKSLDGHKDNINDLYIQNRKMQKEVGTIDGRVKVLEEDKKDSKSNVGTVLIVIGFVVTIIIATIGWLR